MAEPKTVLMTVTGTGGAPTLAEAAAQLGVDVDRLNSAFGVIAIDAAQGRFAVEVDAGALPPGAADAVRGPFSNPPIAGFGPVPSRPAKPDSSEN
ncbi:hypothetical protein [Rhodopseudomonas sp.]|uniref:hypothetical protein n=1 Tax=Rhodopseudomonas sp. TaxID=1078 RepID=UPI003B3A6505